MTSMLIRLAYDIQFELPAPVPMVALLNVHPSRAQDLLEPDELRVEPELRSRPATSTASAIDARASWRLRGRCG
jgi:hypothetical protein